MTIPRAGKALKGTGKALLLSGVVIAIVLRLVPDTETSQALLVISLLPIPMIVGGAFLFWRGRQHAARAIAERVIADSKPDVLYLRAFRTDPSAIGQVFSALLTPKLVSGLATEEEQLGDVLQPFGDLVAVGQPGEGLPKPGAARLYASHEEWKRVVLNQMQAARLVVIRAGSGEGLLWELKQAAEMLNPQKLLILVLHMKKREYESFREKANPILGVSLPAAETVRRFGRVSGFISFSADRKPSFLPLRAPYLRRSAHKPYRPLFKCALRPVFEASGLEWQPPPVSALTVAALIVLGGVVGLLLMVSIATSFY
jgi:hypothetical protein